MIDLSLMRKVEVDGDARIARSQGGATWLDFDAATQAFGLVTPGGVVGSTGVAGLTVRRRDRAPDRAARPDVRQPRRCRGRHAGRQRGPRERRRGRRAALGVAWRRRQLRGGDAPGVPAVPARAGGRRSHHARREGGRRSAAPLPRRRLRTLRASSAARWCWRPWASPRGAGPRRRGRATRAPMAIPPSCGRAALGTGDRRRRRAASTASSPSSTCSTRPYAEDRSYWKSHFVRKLPDELIDLLVGAHGRASIPPPAGS